MAPLGLRLRRWYVLTCWVPPLVLAMYHAYVAIVGGWAALGGIYLLVLSVWGSLVYLITGGLVWVSGLIRGRGDPVLLGATLVSSIPWIWASLAR